MSIVDDSHLTDEVVNEAFEGTNFGRTDFRRSGAKACGGIGGWGQGRRTAF